MNEARKNILDAVARDEFEVKGRIDAVAGELEATAKRIRALKDKLDAWEGPNSGTYVAMEVGRELRQPLGQNAQEFLLRDLASLSYFQGALQALS